MKPELQRQILAEMHGFRGCNRCNSPECSYNQPLDYLNDLHAMHAFEREAGCFHVGDYCRALSFVTSGGNVENMTQYNLLHATAEQRAEAMLRTIGKWGEESQ